VIESANQQLEAGGHLSIQQMAEVFGLVMQGACDEDQVARLLLALHRNGETVAEVAGAAMAMRRHMTPIHSRRAGVLDTCGTGGDGSRTFNISTAAAIVTAAAGVPVAKHGNVGITSRSGSADVLAALGVRIDVEAARVEACLDELGICFCFAPRLHPAMRHVAAVRKKLGVPTIFNILGPLVNPAGAAFQLLGVGRAPLLPLISAALALLDTHRALVVHGLDGLDEVTLAAPTQVVEVTAGATRRFAWEPADFGLPPSPLDSLRVDGPEGSAAVIRSILDGQRGPARDIVLLNAAAALWTVGRAGQLPLGVRQAAEAIDSGAAAGLLARLVEFTGNP
jgi:anthranilate phosphoribosyltransferase